MRATAAPWFRWLVLIVAALTRLFGYGITLFRSAVTEVDRQKSLSSEKCPTGHDITWPVFLTGPGQPKDTLDRVIRVLTITLLPPGRPDLETDGWGMYPAISTFPSTRFGGIGLMPPGGLAGFRGQMVAGDGPLLYKPLIFSEIRSFDERIAAVETSDSLRAGGLGF